MTDVATFEPSADDEVLTPQGRACAECGAPVDLHDRFCNACGLAQQIEIVEAELIEDDQRRFRCENCGAEVATDPDQRSYVCAFCDSTYVIELPKEQTGKQRPEFVIGFALTPDQAREKFRAWLNRSNWFRPGDLSSAKVEDKQRGVYLPFWSFSMLAQSRWSARIGEYWYRTETYTTTNSKGKTVTRTRRVRETEWWDLSGNHHRYYSGYLVSGSRGLPQNEAERIKPFHLPALQRYKPYFLAGWLSEEYSVERTDALDRCEQEFYRREQQNVAAFLPGDTQRNLHVNTGFSQINSDLILLPVYLLSYKYRDKLYRFLVNGQTGKVAGDKPLSWLRICLAAGGGVLLVALVVLMFILLGALG
ncbi:MAG: zinc ribbon domain-containing protein [Planctomycetes bacterium]|nr:zinc ribbon domain-containing protein [Planctomycetota bacterium]